MGLRHWLATRFPDWPVNRVSSVSTDQAGIEFARANGDRESIGWDEIDRVVIRTNDKGPFDDDVFFVLETARESLVIPQPAQGADGLLRALQQLPGFDNETVIESMGCTE